MPIGEWVWKKTKKMVVKELKFFGKEVARGAFEFSKAIATDALANHSSCQHTHSRV